MSGPNVATIDFATMNCAQQCNALLNAYMKGLAGGQRIQVRHGDYWVEYRASNSADMAALRDLYRLVRGQCPAAADMPDLSPGLRAKRGPALPVKIYG
jgi:hypothetical protein